MSLDFEHFIGLNAIPQGALFHPDGQKYIYSSGALVVIGDLTDPHSQQFLRGHSDTVTAVKVSRDGNLIASGQKGANSDIIVWDYSSKRLLYRFEEHDHMIQDLAFSDDGKILVSIGSSDDGNLIAWDMSNGCIISSAARLPPGTTCITFAGFIRDIKRRDTSHYQFVTGGKDGIVSVWDLDPFSGEMTSNRIVTDNARAMLTRHVTSFAVSDDREFLYAGTTSGDYLIISLRNQRIVRAVTATRMAVHNMVCTRDTVILGCGDKGVKVYQSNGDFIRQVDLDGGVVGLSLSHDQLEVTPL
jgi:WD40 repeat protein